MNEIQLIYKKMSQVMKEIGPVTKDQKNVAQGFKFRGIDQFVNALHPALVRNGVFMSPECVKESHELKEVVRSNGKAGVDKHVSILMNYHFYAEDGSKVTIGPIPAEGLDSGDKATNKALSAALKYALIQTFSIPTEDMAEADLDSPEIGSKSSQGSAKQTATVTSISKTAHPVLTAPTAAESEQALLAAATAKAIVNNSTSVVNAEIDAQVAQHLNPTPIKTTFRKPPSKAAEATIVASVDSEWM